MRKMERAPSWWRRRVATPAPAPPDIAERLTRHYAAEVRLARGLAHDAASLVRYPHSQVRLLGAAEHARGRAQRLRRPLEESGQPVADPASRNGPIEPTVRDRLLARASDLSSMSGACLIDAQAVEREHPGIAGLLYDLHRETAEDRRDLIWTVAQLPWTAANTMSHEEIPREVSESRLEEREDCRATGYAEDLTIGPYANSELGRFLETVDMSGDAR